MHPLSVAVLSGALSGCVASLATLAIERLGGLFGGTLSTLPTTIIPASLGIALQLQDNADPSEFKEAMYFVPIGMLVDAVFLTVWRALPPRLDQYAEDNRNDMSDRKKISILIAASLLVWFVLSVTVLLVAPGLTDHVPAAILGFSALVITFWIGVYGAIIRPRPTPKGNRSVSWLTLLCRGLFAGIAIFTAVLVSSYSNTVAGLLSTFPAIFLTSMVAVHLSQGGDVQAGAVGPMMLGSVSVEIYAMSYSETRFRFGLAGGVGVSLALSFLYSGIIAFVQHRIQKRLRIEQEQYSQVDTQIALEMTFDSDVDSLEDGEPFQFGVDDDNVFAED